MPHPRRPRRLPWPLAALTSVAGGVAIFLSFPGTGWWPLAPVGVALGTVAVAGRRTGGGFVQGLLLGAACFLPTLHWAGVYVGNVPWLALGIVEALYVAVLGAVLSVALRGGTAGWRAAALPPVVGGLWVAQEALRGRQPFGGFPWARLAFGQADSPLLRLAALGGAPLVTFAVATAGGALAVGLLRLLDTRDLVDLTGRDGRAVVRRLPPRARLGSLAAAVVAAGLVTGSGLLVPVPTADDGRSIRVAGVQGDVPEAGLDFNAERRAVLDDHVRVTEELAARIAGGTAPQPDVVIWPENSSDLDPFQQADARAVIDEAVDVVGAPTLVGAVLRRPADHLTNASIVWTPGRGPGQLYAKRHPVPFGEYIPYRSFFRTFSSKVDLVTQDYVPGHAVGTMRLGPATVGVGICFEVAYDGLMRNTVTHGADLLVVQTNNATFGYTDESTQQLAMSRLRAVEHGRAVAQVSTVGVSALIAPDGRVLQRTKLFTPATVEGMLPLRTSTTLADRTGAWGEAALAATGLLGALLLALRAGGRRRGRRGTPVGSPGTGADEAAAPVLTEA